MRNKIFISHANPVNNDQARWLSLQLMTLGYDVWCDVIILKGGEKFWKEIENEIRNNTCKFLYILTNDSNQNEGCHKELSVAEAVDKEIGDKRFIIGLHFDSTLKYDNVNINLKQKIDIDFKTDWRSGLTELLKIFAEDPIVPKKPNPDFDFINSYWQSIYLNDRKAFEREEKFTSNWFQFISFPKFLNFHYFYGRVPKKFDWDTILHPTRYYKKYTATFAECNEFVSQMPKTAQYNGLLSKRYEVEKILTDNYGDDFISNRELRNILNSLLKDGFIKTMNRKELLSYEMSKGTAFCFAEDINVYSKFSFGQLVGKVKDNKWHYAFSAYPDLINNVLVIKSHILASDVHGNLIKSDRTQQSIRRKQGKNWWNRHWKQKLLSAVSLLLDDDGILRIQVGEIAFVEVSGAPMGFVSTMSYIDPDEAKEALDEYPDDEEEVEATDEIPEAHE